VTKNANACSNTQILHTQSGALVKAIEQLEGLELESNIGTACMNINTQTLHTQSGALVKAIGYLESSRQLALMHEHKHANTTQRVRRAG
jgi:hypothetical protein